MNSGANYILDHLIQTVKKRNKSDVKHSPKKLITVDVHQPNSGGSELAKHFTQIFQSSKTDVRASPSTVFKKLTKKLFDEQFSILNLTNKPTAVKNKKVQVQEYNPVINITVVPITTETKSSKKFSKRKKIGKKIKETVSNTDSCMQNTFLYFPTYKREIHNIRETSSVDLYKKTRYSRNIKHYELCLDSMRNTKTILNSLNMETTGTMQKHKRNSNDIHVSSRKGGKNNHSVIRECTCKDTKVVDVLDDMNSRTNRVTIFGRLGRDEDDQYILKCAATVDNQPIDIKQENVDSNLNVQNGYDNGKGQQTKATQANIVMGVAVDTRQRNKNVQCQCNTSIDVGTTRSVCEFREPRERKNPLIVISVYRTNDTTEDAKCIDDLIQIKQLQESPRSLNRSNSKNLAKSVPVKQKIESTNSKKTLTRSLRNRSRTPLGAKEDVENKRLRSRSPSPPVKTIAHSENKFLSGRSASPPVKIVAQSENKFLNGRSSSPPAKTFAKSENKILSSRSSSPRVKTVMKVENMSPKCRPTSPPVKYFSNKNKDRRLSKSRSHSPSVEDVAKHEKGNITFNNRKNPNAHGSPERQNRQKLNEIINRRDKPKRTTAFTYTNYGGIKEINSKNNNIKKSLVKDFTQKMLSSTFGNNSMRKTGPKPKTNASQVTIDIDGDNEQYRVLFQQDEFSTDLCVRKNFKKQKPKQSTCLQRHERSEDSMEKILMLSNQLSPVKITKPQNQTQKNQLTNSTALHKKVPGFKIRDSLDFCHWREECNCQNKILDTEDNKATNKKRNKTLKANESNDSLTAPVKHYRGDQCCVPNPFDRDQEIRDLLGIKKPRSRKYEFEQDAPPEFVVQKQLQKRLTSSFSGRSNCCVNDTSKDNIIAYQKPKSVTASTQWEQHRFCSSDKKMVLNRNIQVFLQVEQFTKQKPIMLSRKQYDKVKKTIQKKISNKISHERRRLNNLKKCSVISIGEIRKTKKQQSSNVKISRTVQAKRNFINVHKNERNYAYYGHDDKKPLLLLYPTENKMKDRMHLISNPRKTVSSMEVRYASLAHMRRVTFSSSDLKNNPPGKDLVDRLENKDSPSIETIFKGYKRCATPNLGTSAYEFNSEADLNRSDQKYVLYRREAKSKKPLLRRLMSCLVMRSAKVSKDSLSPRYMQRSMMSSFDSYHISTSLGAMDLTSSLYDTSVSFYSNHTIFPIARMKPGFFSSVRGLFTNLKSR